MGEPLSNIMTANAAPISADTRRHARDMHDYYLALLCIVLVGYSFLGKGFAYVGYPPLLIGELTMALGLVVLFRSGCGFATLATFPSVVLLAMLCLVVLKVIFDLGPYGVDALRDGVIIIYSLYAFAVIALLLEKPDRLQLILRWYSGFAFAYGLLGAAMVYITSEAQLVMPVWPVYGVTIIYVRLGEAAVHLAGAAVFALLGMRKVSLPWVAVLIASIALICPSRGAMLACLVPIGFAALIGGKIMRFAPVLLSAAFLFVLAYAAGLEVPLPGGRSIGPEQIVNNIESIFGNSNAANLDGTKEWRLRWWKAIVDYTFNGPYFWTGKGFGMGLAEVDGFVVGLERGGPVVRSPHNVQLTMLARTGVPGLALWLLTCLTWFGMLLNNILLARKRGETHWANIFTWIACYGGAIVIDGSFDVAIEGPMLGIWFWSLFGLGIGASMIYRYDMQNGYRRFAADPPP